MRRMHYSYQQYLVIERDSDVRHEYLDGEIYAMAGGTPTPAEVTSTSTEEDDRGAKLRHYQMLPSVREILIVSHREPRLTVHRREAADWEAVDARQGERVELVSAGACLAVDDVYRDGLEDAG